MKTRLIIIRGNADTGKSTVAAYVHNMLVEMYKLNNIHAQIPIGNKDLVSTFHAILQIGGKRVSIISEGDIWNKLRQLLADAKKQEPDIIVLCLRSKNRKGSSYRMIATEESGLYAKRIEIWTSFSSDESLRLPLKKAVAEVIVNKIVELLK